MNGPSYYATSPASIRYDKRINGKVLALYEEITTLSAKSGICWATNAYFAKRFGVDSSTIKRWIATLTTCGYVTRTVEYGADGKTVIRRVLKIVDNDLLAKFALEEEASLGLPQNLGSLPSRGWGQGCAGGGGENEPENITRKNKTSINNIPPINPPLENRKQKEDMLADVPEPLKEAMRAFIEYRKASHKPMTKYAVKLVVDKLEKQCSTDEERIDCINESILRGWSGVFPGSVGNRGYGKKQEWKAPDSGLASTEELSKQNLYEF